MAKAKRNGLTTKQRECLINSTDATIDAYDYAGGTIGALKKLGLIELAPNCPARWYVATQLGRGVLSGKAVAFESRGMLVSFSDEAR